eukprot:CAMPEP_0115020566 /NCGR_PEP_ID=MMETSP0216-20121206/30254_1 /TAXON_ID=223996 /ORGANISM="Protocruzia adherens, Strain Boccale" /LENGTH=301 /DNA_ID=CAMNT_0002392529 /DNA_START=99 /DNA_END=1001 /DNA_ORIENTATION=-
MASLQETSDESLCSVHQRTANNYCLSDGSIACDQCISTECQPFNHRLVPIKDLFEHQIARVEFIHGAYESIQSNFAKTIQKFEEVEIERIRSQFANFIHVAEEKCEETISELKSTLLKYRNEEESKITELKKQFSMDYNELIKRNSKLDYIDHSLDSNVLIQKSLRLIRQLNEQRLFSSTFFQSSNLPDIAQTQLISPSPTLKGPQRDIDIQKDIVNELDREWANHMDYSLCEDKIQEMISIARKGWDSKMPMRYKFDESSYWKEEGNSLARSAKKTIFEDLEMCYCRSHYAFPCKFYFLW